MILEEKIILQVQNEAEKELLHTQERNVPERTKILMKNMAKRAVGRYVPPEDPLFWPGGLLARALSERIEDENALAVLEKYFIHWIHRKMPILCLDDALAGDALITLYEKCGKEIYVEGIRKIADYLLRMGEIASDEGGSLLYRPRLQEKYIFVDTVGMICPFLCRYGMQWGSQVAVELALKQIDNMLELGMDSKTGLPYHGYIYKSKVKCGIIGWGRGTGWLLLGMVATARWLPAGERKDKLVFSIGRLVDHVLSYQRPDGSFGWQLEAMEGPSDTSATGMIAWAIGEGLKYRVITFEDQCRKAVKMAAGNILSSNRCGKIYDASGECEGFGQYPQYYGAYPWSLGPGLAVLSLAQKGEEK